MKRNKTMLGKRWMLQHQIAFLIQLKLLLQNEGKCYFSKHYPCNSLFQWPLKNPLTLEFLECDLFKIFHSHFIRISLTSLLPLGGATHCLCLHRVAAWYCKTRLSNTLQVPVTHAVSWPKPRPCLRTVSAHSIERVSPQAHSHIGSCQLCLLLCNGYQTAA